VSEGINAPWETMRNDVMDVCRQGDVWLEDKDVQSPESGSEQISARVLGGAWIEQANSWSRESSSGYETESENDEQQKSVENDQQLIAGESENDEQQVLVSKERLSAFLQSLLVDDDLQSVSESENDEQQVIFNSDLQLAVSENESDEHQVIFKSDLQLAVSENESDEQQVIFKSDLQTAVIKVRVTSSE
jgi:hypothetical protein